MITFGYACAAFNCVLSVTTKKLKTAGLFASLPFLTFETINTLRSIMKKNSTDIAGVE